MISKCNNKTNLNFYKKTNQDELQNNIEETGLYKITRLMNESDDEEFFNNLSKQYELPAEDGRYKLFKLFHGEEVEKEIDKRKITDSEEKDLVYKAAYQDYLKQNNKKRGICNIL